MIEFYLLAGLIGVVVSIEDLKIGLVKNQYVALLICIGLISKFFYPVDATQFTLVLFYGLIVSVLFWLLDIWPAGDAKFFWALLFFLPASLYASSGIVWSFLTNTFVPIFFVMLFFIAHKSRLSLVLQALKEAFNPYTIFMLFLMITGFLWLFQRALAVLGLKSDFLILLISLFIVFELFRRYCTFQSELLFAGLAVIRVLLDYQSFYTLSFFFESAKFILVFAFFRFFILKLAFKLYTDEIPISKLKEGMSPAEGIFKTKGKYKKESLLSTSFIGLMQQKKKSFVHGTECLSGKDVQKLKKLKKGKKLPFSAILIHQNQPFALFILIGFILTVLSSGTFFKLLKFLPW